MAKLQFDNFSAEIKALIVGKILRPTDLKNVCLVSKQMHEIAIKALYNHVALDLGSPNDTRLTTFLNPNNKGLKHIKQLRLYLAPVQDRCDHNLEQQAQLVARLILEFLPEDILEDFSWCPWRPFSADNLLLLLKKQRKLEWMEVMDLDREVLPDLKKNSTMVSAALGNTKKLALYPENRKTLKLCRFFIRKVANVLEDLTIHTNFHDVTSDPLNLGGVEETRMLADSATQPGLITRTLFTHMLPFDACEPFAKLKRLRLHRISLRFCADTWCKFINFTNIEHLRLYNCTGADSLLGQMSKSQHLPQRLRVLEFQHKDNEENEALVALEGFLCLISGLNDLVIDMEDVKSLPAHAAITRHGKTLKILNVHCTLNNNMHLIRPGNDDMEELVWSAEDFEKICKACPQLEQLSCAWPLTSLIRNPSENWKAYERSCANMKNLVTLHISTWPTNRPSAQPLPRTVYVQLLQATAQRGFELAAGTYESPANVPIATNPNAVGDGDSEDSDDDDDGERPPPSPVPSKLRLIAFGINEKIYERLDSPNLIIFLRSPCQNAEGQTRPYATRINWCLRQYVEPRSDVLDFVLHRETKMPCHTDEVGWNYDEIFVDV